MDLFAEGTITTNFIELTPELGELFAIYWSKITPLDRRHGNIAMPYWHLQSDGFWHLIPRPGYESFLQTVSRIHAISKLQETSLGAKLDDALFDLFYAAETRDLLRTTLIETYFAPGLQSLLIDQGKINVQAFLYSQELLQQAKANQKVKETGEEDKPYRDQGFRRAIVKAYDHRCAICGLRILTADGHTAVAAAHIIPWYYSHNDDRRNGLALCPLCHWTFDEGLVRFTDRYQVKTSPQLSGSANLPGHLLTFADRRLIGPTDDDLWPFLDSIRWHRQEVFHNR
jgi:putative restriction endonuclease